MPPGCAAVVPRLPTGARTNAPGVGSGQSHVRWPRKRRLPEAAREARPHGRIEGVRAGLTRSARQPGRLRGWVPGGGDTSPRDPRRGDTVVTRPDPAQGRPCDQDLRKLLILLRIKLVSRRGLEPQTRRLRDSCRSRRSGRFGCWATSRRARTTRRGASFRRPITVDGERSLWPRVPEGEPSAKLNDEITLVVRPAVRWRPDGRTGRLVKGTWPRRGPRRSLRLMESDG